MRIGIDCDGVLANFNCGYAGILEGMGAKKFPDFSTCEPQTWQWERHAGVSKSMEVEAWKRIVESPYFWCDLTPCDGAVDFLKRLTREGSHEVFFITNRSGINPRRQTKIWLQWHGHAGEPTVLICKEKGPLALGLALDVFIDDKTENYRDVINESPKTRVFRLVKPYNSPVNGVQDVRSLLEFYVKAELGVQS